MKNLAWLLLFVAAACTPHNKSSYFKISGFCQGTTYHITFADIDSSDVKKDIDLLLKEFDSSLSTYNKKSVISRFNSNDSTVFADEFFTTAFHRAIEISKASDGAFDITVAPLVNAWGFGFKNKEKISKHLIDSILPLVGYEKVRLIKGKLLKSNPKIMIDCNALAQGYSVDIVSKFLDSRGAKNYMVEIGGEVRVKGRNNQNELWKIGVEKPDEKLGDKALSFQRILKMENISVSTSGNYKNFYIENGIKYAHTIDAKTGYPAKSNILSATVIASDCLTADAFATVCMVLGLEKSKELFGRHPEMGCLLIYVNQNGDIQCYNTQNVAKYLLTKQ